MVVPSRVRYHESFADVANLLAFSHQPRHSLRMIPKSMYLAVVAVAGLPCVSLSGQEKITGGQQAVPHWHFNAPGITQSRDASNIDGDFYRPVPLTQGFVAGMENRVLAAPGYSNTPEWLVASSVYQPPITPETDAAFHIEYAKLSTVQVSQDVVPAIENTGVIQYRLNHCQVSLVEFHKRKSSPGIDLLQVDF